MSGFSTFMSGMPLVGGFFNNDNETELQNQLKNMSRVYDDYRGKNTAMRSSQLGSQLDMFAPSQQMLSYMAPGIHQPDMQKVRSDFDTAAANLTNEKGPAALLAEAQQKRGEEVVRLMTSGHLKEAQDLANSPLDAGPGVPSAPSAPGPMAAPQQFRPVQAGGYPPQQASAPPRQGNYYGAGRP